MLWAGVPRILAPALALASLLTVTTTTQARASDDDRLRLSWLAPASCPSVETVRRAALRNAESGDPRLAGLEAEARVTPSDRGWRMRLRTRHGSTTGEREIETATCEGAAEAAAVILGLALMPPESDRSTPAPVFAASVIAAPLDQPASIATLGPEPERSRSIVISQTGAPPPEPPLPARDATPPEPAHVRAGARSHALAVGVGVAADPSTLPRGAVGGSLSVAWTPGQWRIELDARRFAAQSRTLPGSSAGADFSMTSAGARGCWNALRRGAVDVSPCAGADVHFVSASGYGAGANYDAKAQWTSAAGGALAGVAVASWLALRARLDALVPLSRPTFVVEGEGSLHRPPTLGAAASLGAEVTFL
jgi:hypothetical protein